MDYSDKELRRQIILDRYETPINKIDENSISNDYKTSNNNSPSCIDNINAYVKIKDDKIVDVKFSGIACAISTSSTDIMCDKLKNMNKNEAIEYINEYLKLVDGKEFDKEKLKELNVFDQIHKQLNRIKCAKVGIIAIKNAIEK